MYNEEGRWLNMINPSEIKPTNDHPRYYNLRIVQHQLWHSNPDKVLTIGQKISASKKGKKLGPCSDEKAANIKTAKLAKNPAPPREDLIYAIQNNPTCGVALLAKVFGVSHGVMVRWLEEYMIPVPVYKRPSKPKRKGSTTAERWANPEWAAMMRERLSQGSRKRWDASTAT